MSHKYVYLFTEGNGKMRELSKADMHILLCAYRL